MDIKFGFTSASKNVGNKDENGKRVQSKKGRIAGVFKQGELLENHSDNDNQQPSNDRNIVEGSTTNSRGLTDNADAGNADTSALPTK